MNLIYKIKLYLHLLRYRGLKKKSQYSRWGEDLFLLDYFKETSKGSYIDVGAFHPFRGSNTYLLYNKGWNGINIDLNKTSIDLFNLARPDDINLNFAVSNTQKRVKIYQNKNLGKMNTINPKYASFYLKDYRIRETASYSLNNILEKYHFKSNKFEFINIDAEGSEYMILKNIDFTKYSFKIILVETHRWNSFTQQESNKIHSLLQTNNYNLLKNLGETSIYENNN